MKHLAYQHHLQNPNQFTLNVYQAESKPLSRLMIRSYLTGGTYSVQVADALSKETKIKSGVPQGSVIGRPFAELPLQCLELVGKLAPPYESHQMQPRRYWAGFSTPIIPCHWKSGRFHSSRKRC